MNFRSHTGDVIDVLRAYPADHFDGALTDPPYGLSDAPDAAEMRKILLAWLAGKPYKPAKKGFMGKDWDSFIPGPEYWRELFRVLKPGAHAFVFAAPRTKGLMEVALTLAGFEVIDVAAWIYGSGFPKSMAIDKAIDDFMGASGDREIVGTVRTNVGMQGGNFTAGSESGEVNVTKAATPEAQAFEGWGTRLKPAWEPAILVMKPNLVGYAVNGVLTGVAGINVDAGRIPVTDQAYAKNCSGDRGHADNRERDMGFAMGCGRASEGGRFPSNLMLDEEVAAALDEQVGITKSSAAPRRNSAEAHNRTSSMGKSSGDWVSGGHADSGGPSRYFYVAKASRAERDAGLGELPDQEFARLNPGGLSNDPRFAPTIVKNDHPCVKPISLNRQLAALLLPPEREHDVRRLIVPFSGSSSEMIGGMLAGWDDVTGIELDPKWEPVTNARMRHHANLHGIPIGGR